MKNEYKILIGAIIVILIVLVGAFALSGSNNAQPSVTPTALPVTATPTPVPANGGNTGTGAATPTATPTVVPTATPAPSVTPTPSPSSGVKQTEFGYWITYPPLDPEKWSTNPPPNPGSDNNNTVFFDPTSANVNVPYYTEIGSLLVKEGGTPAVIHRVGDLNETTTVGVYVIPTDNMIWPADDYSSFYIPTRPNMTWISYSYFNLTFGPGVSEQTVYIQTSGVRSGDELKATDAGSGFSGSVKLDIVEVDDGYNIGSGHAFTLNVKAEPSISSGSVEFISDGGYMVNETYFDASSMDVSEIEHGVWKVNITLTRSSTSGSLSPHVSMATNVPSNALYINQQPTFIDGQSTATLQVIYAIDTSINGPYATFSIDPSPSYSLGSNNPFDLDLFINW